MFVRSDKNGGPADSSVVQRDDDDDDDDDDEGRIKFKKKKYIHMSCAPFCLSGDFENRAKRPPRTNN